MEAIHLRPYQIKAISAIQEALACNQKHIVVEMATGCGKGLVLAKTVEMLSKEKLENVLILTDRLEVKAQINNALFNNYRGFVEIDKYRVEIETEQKILRQQNIKTSEYPFIIFYDAVISENVYEALFCKEKTVIVLTTIAKKNSHRLFTPNEIVFSYNYTDAINDGYLTPAMDTRALEPAVEAFSKRLLEQFGYYQIESHPSMQDQGWDFIVYKDKQKIWVEHKVYKSQVVSPSTANSLLKTILMRKMKQDIPQEDIVLLIVLSRIPSFQKDNIYDRYGIIVLDIENLVFYSKSNPHILKQLSQVTYFSIDYIEGSPSKEVEKAGLSFVTSEDDIIYEAEKEVVETSDLIRQLRECKSGKKYSGDYENICEKIVRTLFEANYFNRLTKQHKTKDEHFRMDLIGSLKINQSNEESMHPLWQMLVQHYNSHFVVFEFKNYSNEIDQNLIYITEKYLFDAALRNVAFIISRKGFSKSAKFAAEGCLKEHGKLILDVTEKDLVTMLEVKSDEAADFLLGKLEEFLMGISK